ncbi:MAG: translation initiation factor IF-2 [Firmicutes bacterium]|nr:translation initiation factor IF-2 [Bacillota bacterium]
MSKLRVYEYAKQLNMSSKEIITIMKRLNLPVANHMSTLEPEHIAAIEQFFADVRTKAAQQLLTNQGEQEAPAKPEVARSGAEEAQQEEKEKVLQPTEQAAQKTASPTPVQAVRQSGSPAQQQEHTNAAAERRAPTRPKHSAQGYEEQGRGTTREVRSGASQQERAGQRPAAASKGNSAVSASRRTERPQPAERPHESAPHVTASTLAETRSTTRPAVSPPHRRNDRGVHHRNDAVPGRRHDLTSLIDEEEAVRGGKGGNRRNKKSRHAQHASAPVTAPPKQIRVEPPITVAELARLLHRTPAQVISKLMGLGVMATLNDELDIDATRLVADSFGVTVSERISQETLLEQEPEEEPDRPEDLVSRPPAVTIMGHVDHGKTTLLDAIRSSHVAQQEAGGITQRIGAYQVEINGRKITFLDTPGHEAFTSMRARGAEVTDIAVLVVAADDGVMPQTIEAIHHAQSAKVPIIVAINKIDKPGANPDRVKQQLAEHGLVPEEWGGDTVFVPVSALRKEGIDDLLEMILLVADLHELKANPNKPAKGTIIEAELDKTRGPVATCLIKEGTLHVGDVLVAGASWGRVRAMLDERGRRLKEAPPSTPVVVTGLSSVPEPGDIFRVYEDEHRARMVAEYRSQRQHEAEITRSPHVSLQDLYRQMQEGQVKQLNIVLKSDVQGSVEALRQALEKIDVEGAKVNIVHAAVGAINESDVLLAAASNAVIIGFNVRPDPNTARIAEEQKVDVRLYRVIYEAVAEVESALRGLLEPVYSELALGRAEVRTIFHSSKAGTIAGCLVVDGKIERNAKARVIRDGVVVYDGNIASLRRFKDDVREVASGYECGILLERFNDVKQGDIIEAYEMRAAESA